MPDLTPSQSTYFVFTRNWIDPKGIDRGFRCVKTTHLELVAQQTVADYQSHHIAKDSVWEYVGGNTEELIFSV